MKKWNYFFLLLEKELRAILIEPWGPFFLRREEDNRYEGSRYERINGHLYLRLRFKPGEAHLLAQLYAQSLASERSPSSTLTPAIASSPQLFHTPPNQQPLAPPPTPSLNVSRRRTSWV